MTYIIIAISCIIDFILCGLVGNIAREKGRSWSTGFWFAFFLSPIIGLLYFGFVKEVERKEKKKSEDGYNSSYDNIIVAISAIVVVVFLLVVIIRLI